MPERVSREAILFSMSQGVGFEIEHRSPSCEITETSEREGASPLEGGMKTRHRYFFLSEALAAILRFITDDWCIEQHLVCFQLLAKSLTGEEIAQELISTLQVAYEDFTRQTTCCNAQQSLH